MGGRTFLILGGYGYAGLDLAEYLYAVLRCTAAYAREVVTAALAAGVDYLDIQYAPERIPVLQSLAGRIEDDGPSGRPNAHAPRYAAHGSRRSDGMRTDLGRTAIMIGGEEHATASTRTRITATQ